MNDDLMTLSFEDVQRMSLQLAHKVEETPDLVVYVAKGAFLIGQTIAEFFDVPLLEIEAMRSKSWLKGLVRPLLPLLPDSLKARLRKKEIDIGIHTHNTERCALINDPNNLQDQDFSSILLVDDSVDTGNTIVATMKALQDVFPQAHIITASFFVFEASKPFVGIDYYLNSGTIFSAPWSIDSIYYKEFMRRYKEMKPKAKN